MRTQDDAIKSLILLAKRAYDTSYQKGFWEDPRSEATLLMLMVSELAEALEEVRDLNETLYFRGRSGLLYSTPEVLLSQATGYYRPIYSTADMILKPEGVAVEIGDYMIRVLDLLGSQTTGVTSDNIENVLKVLFDSKPETKFETATKPRTLSDDLFVLTRCTVRAGEPGYPMGHLLTHGLVLAYKLLESLDLDPIEIIEMKMDYNDTREYKHGKAF